MSRDIDRLYLLAWCLAFAALSATLAVASRGFLEADGVTHYLYARWASTHPALLFDVWGRPVVTALHAGPAQVPGALFGLPIGLVGVRLTSLVVALGCAAIAYRVARIDSLAALLATRGGGGGDEEAPTGHASRATPLTRRPALAGVFTLASPLVFLHSFGELTELPFALLSVACLWAYVTRRWVVLALLAGLLPAARPEGIGFLGIVAVGLVLHRRLLALPLILVGPAVWAIGGWVMFGRPGVGEGHPLAALPTWLAGPLAWLPANWPYSGDSAYRAGPLLKFVGMLPAVVGPGLLPFTLIGIIACLRGWRGWRRDHAARVAGLVAAVPLFVLIVHSLLHWTGRMASSGDVRYLVAVAPFWGILTARGFAAAAAALAWRRPYLVATVLAIVPPIALQTAYPIVPLAMTGDAREAEDVIAPWLAANPIEGRADLRVDHPVVMYANGLDPLRRGSVDLAVERPAGVVWVWHAVYSRYNADGRLTIEAEVPPSLGWHDATPPSWPAGWRLFVSDPV